MSHKTQNLLSILLLIAIFILNALPVPAKAQTMNLKATGEFDVTIKPQAEDAGLSGKLAIRIEDSRHFCDFDYSIVP
jgi:hypothetical protein